MKTKENIVYFESIIEEMLGVLDSHKVSLEDGTLITESLYLMSLSYLKKEGGASKPSHLGNSSFSSKIGDGIIPHNMIGIDRGWGMDSALLDEEN
jgi:hypothetical protein